MADLTIDLKLEGGKVVSGQLKKTDKQVDELTKSTKSATSGFKKMGQSLKGIGSSLTSLKGLAAGFAAAFAVNKLVEAANIQEDAINGVKVALEAAGEASQETISGFESFASQLQQNSKFGDEAILQNVALAKSLGVATDQIQPLIAAAADASAATGKDLRTSVEGLVQTLSGAPGSFARYVPALRNFSKEQLKAGAAVEFFSSQFGGAALGQLNTFSGATTQLSNTFGDLLEELGFIITKNPVIIAGVTALNKVFQDLGGSVSENRDALISFASQGFLLFVDGAEAAIKATSFFIRSFNGIRAAVSFTIGVFSEFASSVLGQLAILATGIEDLYSIFNVDPLGALTVAFARFEQAVFNTLKKVAGGAKDFFDFLGVDFAVSAFEGIEKGAASAETALKNVSQSITESALGEEKPFRGFSDGIKELAGGLDDLGDTSRETASDFLTDNDKIEESFGGLANNIRTSVNGAIASIESKQTAAFKNVESNNVKSVKTVAKSAKKQATDVINFVNELQKEFDNVGKQAVADPFKAAVDGLDNLEKKFEQIKPKLTEKQIFEFEEQLNVLSNVQLVGIGAGFGKEILNGAKGAQNLLVSGAKAGINALAPGVGDAVAPLLDAFAAGPEAVRKQVREFAKALPEIAIAIVESIPAFIDELVAQLPYIIERFTVGLIRAAPRIATGIVTGLIPGIGNASGLISNSGEIFKETVGGVGRFIANAGKQFFSFVAEGGRELLRAIGNIGKEFFNIIVGSAGEFFGIIFDSGLNFFGLITDSGVNFISEILSGAGRFVEELISKIPIIGGLLSGGGGGAGGIIGGAVGAVGGVVESVGDVFGFASGGLIPQGFPNDTFNAGLTSGEFVVNNALTPRLDRFLAQQEQGSVGTDPALQETLFRIQDSLQQPIEAEATVQFNQDTLANIIINLNRSNRRLA